MAAPVLALFMVTNLTGPTSVKTTIRSPVLTDLNLIVEQRFGSSTEHVQPRELPTTSRYIAASTPSRCMSTSTVLCTLSRIYEPLISCRVRNSGCPRVAIYLPHVVLEPRIRTLSESRVVINPALPATRERGTRTPCCKAVLLGCAP